MRNVKTTGIDPLRRKLLKGAAGLFATAATPAFFHLPEARAAEMSLNGKKALIAYYSRTGNTRTLAGHIQSLTGADSVELQPLNPYPEDYRATTRQAKREIESGFKPALKNGVENLASYDVVFVGSPCWWSTIAGPVRTFLADSDLSGKTIAPFMTHEGSGLGRSVADIKKLCPESIVLEGLAVRGGSVASSLNEAVAWLRKIKLGKYVAVFV